MNQARTRWNWPVLLGPLLALVGFASYFTLFYWWPVVRDVPWLNYALLVLALALSVRGLQHALGRGALRVSAAVLGTLFSFGVSALFLWYVTAYSRNLPDAASGLPLGAPVPAVTLQDHQGEPVDLRAIDGPLVLVFYRGFW